MASNENIHRTIAARLRAKAEVEEAGKRHDTAKAFRNSADWHEKQAERIEATERRRAAKKN